MINLFNFMEKLETTLEPYAVDIWVRVLTRDSIEFQFTEIATDRNFQCKFPVDDFKGHTVEQADKIIDSIEHSIKFWNENK